MEKFYVDHAVHGRGVAMDHQIQTVVVQGDDGPQAVPMSFLLCLFIKEDAVKVVSPDEVKWVSIPSLEEEEEEEDEESSESGDDSEEETYDDSEE